VSNWAEDIELLYCHTMTGQMMARLLAEIKTEIRISRERMTAGLETKIGPNNEKAEVLRENMWTSQEEMMDHN
jgi:hypothetical protein